MILINLLPHREIARQQARRQFNGYMVGAAIVGGLLAAGAYAFYQGAIGQQESRNAFLSDEIKGLDAQIKEVAKLEEEIASLKARQAAVEGLQMDRNLPVHLLNESVSQLPDGIYLSGIRQSGANVLITGVAQSNERVSELLRNLSRHSEWLLSPQLVEIVGANLDLAPGDQRRVYNFTVNVQLKRPSDSDAGHTAPTATPQKGR